MARLANLANQLLDLGRLDADLTVFQPLNLVDLVAQVTADMAPLAIAAGDEISFDAEVDRATVIGDAASLSRATVNLVQNAVIHGGTETAIRIALVPCSRSRSRLPPEGRYGTSRYVPGNGTYLARM